MLRNDVGSSKKMVHRKPGSWSPEDDGVQYEPLCALPFQKKGDWFSEHLRDPPTPQPLLFLPLIVGTQLVRSLLDSEASDSFISANVVTKLGL